MSASLAQPTAAQPHPAARATWLRLWPLSLAEWRHHPWRHGVALLAVALGVALAASVQMINASALAEFGQAVRSVNGEPDAVLAAVQRDGFDDAVYARLALDEAVALASPVLELETPARIGPGRPVVALKLVGVDAFKVAAIAPALLPRPAEAARPPSTAAVASSAAAATASSPASASAAGKASAAEPSRGPLDTLSPELLYLNPAAQKALAVAPGQTVELSTPQGWQRFTVGGRVAASGGALAVLDIAAAQTRLGRPGKLSRIDLRLQPGTDRGAWQAGQLSQLPAGARWAAADDSQQRVSNLSRAYRVNLSVLALVALLVGGFLVYSVVSLSVAQRTPQLALLGVLGLAAGDRRALVLAESAVVGLAGSALGLAAGAGLATLALRLLGGDLGGGYFSGGAPVLVWPWPLLAACFALGLLAALAGAWWPARQAEQLAPALALKGLGSGDGGGGPRARWLPGLGLLAAGALLALAPPVAGLPLAAYAAVALLLAGGVLLVPAMVQALLSLRAAPAKPVALLAWRRAHFARQTASATVAGVVASLALSVAITVMVASFRQAVADWLDTVLPADLYVRPAGGAGVLPEGLATLATGLPGVLRVEPGRQVQLSLDPQQPSLTLVSRRLGSDPSRQLPLLGEALPPRPGELGAWVSEPAAALYGWQAGQQITLPLQQAPQGRLVLRVRGVWRDYARQFGAVAIDATDYQRLTGDRQANDLALWLAPGTSPAEATQALQAATAHQAPLETISTQALRSLSLAIFDRSFAVTLYLQAVAIGVGLVGVAASLSAQVLSRRKEFGLLAHLGFTRRQVMALVAAETGAWLAAGVLLGLLLGLAMAVVLVKVVNPQSFHWSMPLLLPASRLALLALAVLAAGLGTAWWSARRAAGRDAVQSVKEDW